MQLSLKTDYALRILMALASSDDVLSVDWMAEHYGISRNHLAKVAQQLNASGLIKTTRGRGGGMQLAHAPSDINVGLLSGSSNALTGSLHAWAANPSAPSKVFVA